MEPWRLLAHNHWFTIRARNREIKLCARCSGYASGFIGSILSSSIIWLPIVNSLEENLQVLFSLFLVIPFAIDWLSHTWKLRESNNTIRYVTGVLMGISVYLFYIIKIPYEAKATLFLGITTLILLINFFKKFRK